MTGYSTQGCGTGCLPSYGETDNRTFPDQGVVPTRWLGRWMVGRDKRDTRRRRRLRPPGSNLGADVPPSNAGCFRRDWGDRDTASESPWREQASRVEIYINLDTPTSTSYLKFSALMVHGSLCSSSVPDLQIRSRMPTAKLTAGSSPTKQRHDSPVRSLPFPCARLPAVPKLFGPPSCLLPE